MGYISSVPGVGIFPYGNGTGFASCSLRSARHAQPFRFPDATRIGTSLSDYYIFVPGVGIEPT
jgi:hypothetical protein